MVPLKHLFADPVHFCFCCSGKGGVGKSMIACNLGRALSHHGKTLVLDGDVRGPSVAIIMGVEEQSMSARDNQITFVNITDTLHIASIRNLAHSSQDAPISWDTYYSFCVLADLIEEAVTQNYTFIVVDTEASSGELLKDVVQHLHNINQNKISSVVVSTAGEQSVYRTRKMLGALQQWGVRIAGCIENMSRVGRDTTEYYRMLSDYQIKDLGSIGFSIEIEQKNDEGTLDLSKEQAIMNAVERLL